MKPRTVPSLFDSFNARFLPPETVAKSFVPPNHFWRLCRPCHSVILGPRGSGKTSLLKMLQTRALKSWKHPRADEVVGKLDFVGVFIPTDIIWHEQLAQLATANFSDAEARVLTESAVTLHVLRAFVIAVIDEFVPETIHVTAGPRGAIKLRKEKEVVEYLARLWRLSPTVPTLSGIQMALTERLSDIGFFIAEEQMPRSGDRATRMAEKGLIFPDFLSAIRPALEAVNVATSNTDLRWALCFDELELAPPDLQTRLIRLLRSTEPCLLFKLSMSPFTQTKVEAENPQTRADEDEDFNLIPLWYAEKGESSAFSLEIAQQLLANAQMARTDPNAFFGGPFIPNERDGERSAYARGSQRNAELEELRKNDPSFREYLRKKHVDLNRIEDMSEDDRATLIRKPFPSVVHRNYFYRFKSLSEKEQHARSRKSFGIYTGWEGIAAVCEGNPRWLKGIILNILNKVSKGSASAPKHLQWSEIEEARHRFRSKLKTIRITEAGRDRGVLRLLDVVGDYFKKELLGEHFCAEPTASFTLDDAVAGTYASAVASALNAGALVYLPGDKNKLILNDAREKRFRLAYLLATEYKIPLRIGVGVNLSKILSRDRDTEQRLLGLDSNE